MTNLPPSQPPPPPRIEVVVTNVEPAGFIAYWPMQTTTNLLDGTWSNEIVKIYIITGEEKKKKKFYKPRENQ